MIVNWAFGLACFYFGLSLRNLLDCIERARNGYGLVEDNPIILAAIQAVCALVLMVIEIVRLAGVLNG